MEVRVAVLENEKKALKEDIEELKNDLKGLRKALWGFAFAILIAVISYVLTTIQIH